MSVITVGDISFAPYAMYNDPGLPERIWRASLSSLGDASGGVNTCQLNLKSAGVSPGNIFSLERLSFHATAVGVTAVKTSLGGMETWPPGFDIPEWTDLVRANDAGTTADLPLLNALTRLFIGRAADDGTAGTIAFQTSNDDGETNDVTVTGYLWTPGAINAPGGPRRPLEGVFSN